MPDNDDLFFFGRISASVSHELKNVLAVINEQAGLLSDLACLAGRGMPLDPERLAMAAECLLKQVRRGDGIIGQFNRFAHTTDTPRREVSLTEIADLVVTLAARQAAMRQVGLETLPGPELRVTTDPFSLCRLVHLLLEGAMTRPGSNRTLTLGPAGTPESPGLCLSGLDPKLAAASTAPLDALAQSLDASLHWDTDSVTLLWSGRA